MAGHVKRYEQDWYFYNFIAGVDAADGLCDKYACAAAQTHEYY